MNSRAAVAALAGSVAGSNLDPEALIGLLALPDTSPLRCREAGARHPQRPAHQRDLKLAPICLNAGVDHGDSLAKYAAACFRKAYSCLACSNSRRNRQISSRLSAGRFHVRSMTGRSPSSRATWVSGFSLSLANRTASMSSSTSPA